MRRLRLIAKHFYLKIKLTLYFYRNRSFFRNGFYVFMRTYEDNVILCHTSETVPGTLPLSRPGPGDPITYFPPFFLWKYSRKTEYDCTSSIMTNHYFVKSFDCTHEVALVSRGTKKEVEEVLEKYEVLSRYIKIAEHRWVNDTTYSEQILSGKKLIESSDHELKSALKDLISKYGDYRNIDHSKKLGKKRAKKILKLFLADGDLDLNIKKEIREHYSELKMALKNSRIIILHKDLTHRNCLLVRQKDLVAFDIGDAETNRFLDLYDIAFLTLKVAAHSQKGNVIRDIYRGVYDEELKKLMTVNKTENVGKLFLLLSNLVCSYDTKMINRFKLKEFNYDKIDVRDFERRYHYYRSLIEGKSLSS